MSTPGSSASVPQKPEGILPPFPDNTKSGAPNQPQQEQSGGGGAPGSIDPGQASSSILHEVSDYGVPLKTMFLTTAQVADILQLTSGDTPQRGQGETSADAGPATPARKGDPSTLLELPAGSLFSVYDSQLVNHYDIPSERVSATSGALKYVTYHERYGMQTRFRFQLCQHFSAGRCPDGKTCRFIHADIEVGSRDGTSIHLNENLNACQSLEDVVESQRRPLRNTHRYTTLPAGLLMNVYAPNAHNETPQAIYSSNILKTDGSLLAYNYAVTQLGGQPQETPVPSAQPPRGGSAGIGSAINSNAPTNLARPRHCAHFQFRKMCNLGSACSFIHSLAPYVQPKYRQAHEVPLLPASDGVDVPLPVPAPPMQPPPPPAPVPVPHDQQQQQPQLSPPVAVYTQYLPAGPPSYTTATFVPPPVPLVATTTYVQSVTPLPQPAPPTPQFAPGYHPPPAGPPAMPTSAPPGGVYVYTTAAPQPQPQTSQLLPQQHQQPHHPPRRH